MRTAGGGGRMGKRKNDGYEEWEEEGKGGIDPSPGNRVHLESWTWFLSQRLKTSRIEYSTHILSLTLPSPWSPRLVGSFYALHFISSITDYASYSIRFVSRVSGRRCFEKISSPGIYEICCQIDRLRRSRYDHSPLFRSLFSV